MPQISHAIILAAGIGQRIRAKHPDLPKGFLRIGNETLIERSIRLLCAVGIRHILIVTGYQAHSYESLKTRWNNLETVHNPDYAVSGSMWSLYHALQWTTEPFLLLESDLIYERRALNQILDAPHPNTILLAEAIHYGDEVFVETQNARITRLSKNQRALSNIDGILVGISKMDNTMLQALCRYTSLHLSETKSFSYEDCITAVAPTQAFAPHKSADLIWAEIDTAADLDRVTRVVYPQMVMQNDEHSNVSI